MPTDEEWAAQINTESRGNQAAVSPVGATGVAQVMKKTGPEAAALAGLPWDENLWKTDAKYNSAIGRAYMAKQEQDFGDRAKALAAYNWGPDRLRRLIAAKGDNWQDFLPTETKNYIASNGGGRGMSNQDPDIAALMQLRNDRPQTPYPQEGEKIGLDQLREMIGGGKPKQAPSDTGATPEGASAPVSPTPTQPKPRSLAQKAGRVALDIAGGVGGAAGGFALGGPIGAVAGAGLGSAGASLLSESFDPSESPAGEAVMSGVMGAAGQGVAGALGHLLPTSVRPGGKELLEVLGKRLPVPGQYFDSKAMEVLHNVGMSSFVGADSLEKATQAALAGARKATTDYQQQVVANLARGGEELNQVAMAANALNANANISQIRAAARAIPSSVPADSGVRNVARILTETTSDTLPFSRTMEETMANAMAQARGLPITPKGTVGLKELRTQLMDVMRESTNTAEKQAARNLMKLVDSAAESSLSKLDPKLASQWRDAGAYYTEGIQGKEIGTILSKALVSGGEKGEVSGKALLNALKEHRLDTLKTELSDVQVENLTKFAKAISAAEGSGSKAFTLVSNGLQVNAVIRTAMAAGAGGAAAGLPGAGAGAALVLLGPAAVAKILSSEKVMRLMLAASRMPAGSKQAGILGTQLVSQMFREGILTADESPTATGQGQPATTGTPPPE